MSEWRRETVCSSFSVYGLKRVCRPNEQDPTVPLPSILKMIFPLDWKSCDFFYLPSLHFVAGTYLLECRSKKQDGGADGNYLRCAFKSLTSCCRWSMQGLCSSCVNFFGWRLERVRFSRAWPDSFLQSAWPSWMLWSSPRRPPAPPCAAVPDPPQISPVLPPVERKHKGFFFWKYSTCPIMGPLLPQLWISLL